MGIERTANDLDGWKRRMVRPSDFVVGMLVCLLLLLKVLLSLFFLIFFHNFGRYFFISQVPSLSSMVPFDDTLQPQDNGTQYSLSLSLIFFFFFWSLWFNALPSSIAVRKCVASFKLNFCSYKTPWRLNTAITLNGSLKIYWIERFSSFGVGGQPIKGCDEIITAIKGKPRMLAMMSQSEQELEHPQSTIIRAYLD